MLSEFNDWIVSAGVDEVPIGGLRALRTCVGACVSKQEHIKVLLHALDQLPVDFLVLPRGEP